MSLCCENLNLVAALKFVVNGLKLVVYLGTYAVCSHIGVNGKGKVNHRTSLWHGTQLSLWGEYENLGRVQVQFYGIKKIH